MLKPLLSSLTFFAIGIGLINAQDPVVSISTTIPYQASYVTGYNSEFKLVDPGTQLSWTAKCFNNNNSAWNDIRCGSKSGATTATITTDFDIAEPINRVEVEISRYKSGSSNRMNAMNLLVSANADMSDCRTYPADISDVPTTIGGTVAISIPIDEPMNDMYYQVSIDMPKVSSEGVFSVNSIKYYAPGLIDEPGVSGVELDFTDKDNILGAYADSGTILPGGDYSETGTNNLDGSIFSIGDMFVSFSKAAGTIPPRWWESKTINPELRLNPDNVMTIEMVKPSCKLLEVKFLRGNASESYYNSLNADVTTNLGNAELVDKKWSAPESGKVDNIKMTFKDYCRCGGIRILYFDEDEGFAGVETIEVDVDDVNRPVEYFNLHGVKINEECIAPGIYIKRKGSLTSKIIVR